MARQRVKNMARKRKAVHAASWDGVTDEEILERDRWRCWLCRKRIGRKFRYPHPRSASIDHEVPLSLGGDDTALNKRAAHLGCNMARNNQVQQMPLFGYAAEAKLPSLERNCKGCGVIFLRKGSRLYCLACRPAGAKHGPPAGPARRTCHWCHREFAARGVSGGRGPKEIWTCPECHNCSGCGKRVAVGPQSLPPDRRLCHDCRQQQRAA